MTAGSVENGRAPVVVLGLGNLLLTDDGVGLRLLQHLESHPQPGSPVEFVDGGTQGLALLGYLAGRKLALILDAVGLGAAPGTIHVLGEAEIADLRPHKAGTAHEGNALELLALARLLGECAERTVVIGIEPEHVRTGVGLSPAVEAAIPVAAALVVRLVEEACPHAAAICSTG